MNKNNLQPKPLFIERMKKLLPEKKDFQNYLEILKVPPVRSIRCNKLKISPSELKNKLEAKGWKIKQPWQNHPEVMIVEGKSPPKNCNSHSLVEIDNSVNKKNYSLLNLSAKRLGRASRGANTNCEQSEPILTELEPGELGRALEYQLGYYYIQELASMLPVIVLEPKKNEMILDLCAAPGSKTTQMTSEMQKIGTIIANEILMGRLKILASNLERCGAANTILTKKDGSVFCRKLKKYTKLKFDKILVDAPCSGEGTLRSTPKTYLMWNIKTIKSLSRLQKQLLASAIEILKPEGSLVYSTCTHAPEENEGVVDYILKEFRDKIKLEEIKLPIKFRPGISGWAGGNYSPQVKKCARIYPHDSNTEGFFIAKIKKLK